MVRLSSFWLLVLFFSFGCRPRNFSDTASDDFSPSTRPRVLKILDSKVDIDQAKSINPAEAYRHMNRAQRYVIANLIVDDLVSRLKPSKNEDVWKALSLLLPEEHKSIGSIRDLKAALIKNANSLSYFPTVALEGIPKLQSVLFELKQEQAIKPRPFAEVDGKTYILKSANCVSPTASHTLVDAKANLYSRDIPVDQEIEPCFHENSHTLAKVMNVLAEMQAEKMPTPVLLTFADGKTESLRSYEDLVATFKSRDYIAELFTTRAFVDFLGYEYKENNQFMPLELPTWFSHRINQKSLVLPGEHSEIGLMLYKNREARFAQLKFFLGVPDSKYPGRNTFWRAYTSKRPAWHQTTHDYVEKFYQAKYLKLTDWLVDLGEVMLALQSTLEEYHLPFQSYGFFVCSDSVAIAFGYHQRRANDQRETYGYPLMRVDRVKKLRSNNFVDFMEVLGDKLKVKASTLKRNYPIDAELSEADFKARIDETFPEKDSRLKEFFPDTYKNLKEFPWP